MLHFQFREDKQWKLQQVSKTALHLIQHVAASLTLQLQKFEDETLENNEKEGSSSAPRYNAHHEAANVQAAEAVHDMVHTEQSSNLLLFVRVQPG